MEEIISGGINPSLKQELMDRLGVPENWDKYDYQTQRYSFEDIHDVLEDIMKMKQPKIRIKDINGKDWGDKKVTSMHWKDSLLWLIVVDFMDDGNSNNYLAFYIEGSGKYISENENLIGELSFPQ